jgi:sugar lactone lactonase YvrE
MKKIITLLAFVLCFNIQAQIITTVAGNGTAAYSGDGGQATNASLNVAWVVSFDAQGNMFIADNENNCVRKVNTNGIISTFAGNGTAGSTGDGGQATAAELNVPEGIAFDAIGNVYINESMGNVIRKVNTAGIITTIAGINSGGFSGDGGQATVAELNGPFEAITDAAGNLYIADAANQRIRKINTSGVISTIAGGGSNGGDGGQATDAALANPIGIAFDAVGNLYIGESGRNRVRKVNTLGIISTFAGIGGNPSSGGNGGAATLAGLYNPKGIAFDAVGNVYIADGGNNQIRMVNTNGIISTVVGSEPIGYSGDGGLATNALLNSPAGITFDAVGNLFIADGGNSVIRKVTNVGQMGISEFTNKNEQINMYPNPAKNETTVAYDLPQGVTTADLVFYNITGQEVKRFKVSNAFKDILISTADLEAGTYYYQLQAAGANSAGKKMIIIK